MQAIWTLAIYNQSGATVATAYQHPNDAPNFTGDMNALMEALPGITHLADFLIDPDEQARAAYTAYAEAWEATYDSTRPTWDELKAMPQKASLVTIWQKTAAAASKVNPALN